MFREQDKHFLWSLYAAASIILIWKGVWEGIYVLADAYAPALSNPFVFLFIGLAILTLSGLVFKEFDPLGGLEKAVSKVLHTVQVHPRRVDFQVKYFDKNKKKEYVINGK